ncbi:MAG: SHOCT domain-containing protein [Anaerolineae bacterium]|nr:SHOCT domain-containing protein [Anaerolineae bacterium]
MMFMGLFWLVPLILIGLPVAYALGWRPGNGQQPPRREEQSPLDILKARYARGEISREEYQEMRRGLGA